MLDRPTGTWPTQAAHRPHRRRLGDITVLVSADSDFAPGGAVDQATGHPATRPAGHATATCAAQTLPNVGHFTINETALRGDLTRVAVTTDPRHRYVVHFSERAVCRLAFSTDAGGRRASRATQSGGDGPLREGVIP
jgi:hypothetical protein